MTDGREQAIGGHNKPIAIRSLGCDAIGIAIHKFLATMVGNRESDFRGAQWIGRLLRLEGDALVGAHAFPVVDDRVQLALKPDGGRVVNLPTKLQLLLLRVPTERNINGVGSHSKSNNISQGRGLVFRQELPLKYPHNGVQFPMRIFTRRSLAIGSLLALDNSLFANGNPLFANNCHFLLLNGH